MSRESFETDADAPPAAEIGGDELRLDLGAITPPTSQTPNSQIPNSQIPNSQTRTGRTPSGPIPTGSTSTGPNPTGSTSTGSNPTWPTSTDSNPTGDLLVDLDEPAPAPADPTGRPSDDAGRRRARWRVVAPITLALVVGVLGGTTSARMLLQTQADADTRIVVAITSEDFGYEPQSPPGGDTLIGAEISLAGRLGDAQQIVVESIRTPLGDFELYPPVRLRPGEKGTATLMRGTVNCAAIHPNQDVTAALLDGSVARVQPAGGDGGSSSNNSSGGTQRLVEVGVQLANPTTPLGAVTVSCSPDLAPQPVLEITEMTVRTDGSIMLLVTPTARMAGSGLIRMDPAEFGLIRMDPDAPGDPEGYTSLPAARRGRGSADFAIPDSGWTVTTTPALPLTITGPTTITLTLHYACTEPVSATARALPEFPQLVSGGSLGPGPVQAYVEGWDGTLLTTAAQAAAIAACAKR